MKQWTILMICYLVKSYDTSIEQSANYQSNIFEYDLERGVE